MFGQTTVLRRHDRSPWAVLGHAHTTSGDATFDHASAAHAKHFAAASLVELWVPDPWFFLASSSLRYIFLVASPVKHQCLYGMIDVV